MKDIREIIIVNGLPREPTGSAISHCFTNGASARPPTGKMFKAMVNGLADKGTSD